MLGSPKERIGEIFSDCFRSSIREKEDLEPTEWVEKYVILSKMSSAIAGPYRFDQTPALRWVTDQMGNPEIRQITILKSVQFGGTQFMINFLLLGIALGKPLLYVGQTESDVKKFLRAKFNPVEKTCEPVAALKVPGRSEWNVKQYADVILDIGWGSSVNSLASSSKPWVARDEIDKWKPSDKDDIHPVEAAEERTTAFSDESLMLDTCTPTVEDGAIYQLYLKGSQHALQVKCPSCGRWQEMIWSKTSIWWPDDCTDQDGNVDMDRAMNEARYVCENEKCKAHWDEDDRLEVLDDLKPVRGNPHAASSHISLRVSAFYSKFMSLPKIVKRFLEGRKTPAGIRAFYTQVLGLPYKPEAVTNDSDTIQELKKRTPFEYHRVPREKGLIYDLPFEPHFISTTVDVQGASFWIMQCAFTKEGHCAILDWGEVYSWKEILTWQKRVYSYDGKVKRSRFNFIDSGYKAKALGGVYQFVIRQDVAFSPCVGRENKLFEVVQSTTQNWRGRAFELYSFQDSFFKELLYQHVMPALSEQQLWFPKIIDNTLIDQLTDECLKEVETMSGRYKGQKKMEWFAQHNNNHLGDCLKMQFIIWEVIMGEYAENKKNEQSAKERKAKGGKS